MDFLSADDSVTQHHNKNALNAVNNLNDNKNTRRHCEQHLLCPREVDLVFARTLSHRIVGVWHLSRGLFLSILGGAGYYINYFAFAVGDNFTAKAPIEDIARTSVEAQIENAAQEQNTTEHRCKVIVNTPTSR